MFLDGPDRCLQVVLALAEHPHLRRVEARHELGTVSLPAPPVRADWEGRDDVPSLDEHGAAIRREFTL